jgi:hypothetical protein
MKAAFFNDLTNILTVIYWDREHGISKDDIKVIQRVQCSLKRKRIKPKTEKILKVTIHKN